MRRGSPIRLSKFFMDIRLGFHGQSLLEPTRGSTFLFLDPLDLVADELLERVVRIHEAPQVGREV